MFHVDECEDAAVGMDDDTVGFIALVVPGFGMRLVLGVAVRVTVGADVGAEDLLVGDSVTGVGNDLVRVGAIGVGAYRFSDGGLLGVEVPAMSLVLILGHQEVLQSGFVDGNPVIEPAIVV